MRQWADLLNLACIASLLLALAADIHLPGLSFEHASNIGGSAAILWAPVWN
jgi:hypothetical protein